MISLVGGVTYGAAAAALLVLLSLLTLAHFAARRSAAAWMLIGACGVSLAWVLSAAAHSVGAVPAAWVQWIEIARNLAWLAFLAALLPLPSSVRARALVGVGVVAVVLATAAVLVLSGVASHSPPGAVVLLVLCIALLVAVEQVYRNNDEQGRWRVKFLGIGLAVVFGYDVFLYADALLFASIDPYLWAARGAATVLAVPLIAVAAARNPQWRVEVFVSRQVVFHSAVLTALGVGLSAMAAAGYYVRYFGGTWGSALQALAVAGAACALLAALLSGALRARLRVFLGKHFFSSRFDYRDAWLRFTRTLATPGEPHAGRNHVVRAMAELVDADAGTLWLKREGGFACAASWNVAPIGAVEAVDSPFMRFMRERQWVIDVDEFRLKPSRYPAVAALPAWLLAEGRAQIVAPLVSQDALLGFVLLDRPHGALKVDWEVHDLLKTAGRQAASYLAQVESAEALAAARQFESFNRLAAFVVHDLKNVVGQLGLLAGNAARHRDNPEFQNDMFETVEHAVTRMRRLLAQLGGQDQERARVPQPLLLHDVLQAVVGSFAHHVPRPVLTLCSDPLYVLTEGERLGRIVGHLVQNAVEATPVHGTVEIRLERAGTHAVVRVRDAGCGMSAAFIQQRLYKPFTSTKAGGMGIGVYEARQFVLEAGGDLEVSSRPGVGTEFTMRLPSCAGAASLEHARGTG